jgi:DNA-directed RNA polymerase subunit RPC12/RpoP
MWPNKLSEEELKKIKSILGETNVVGAESGDYFLFICTNCGKEIDLTYRGLDPSAPYFTYNCSNCKKKGSFKFQIPKSHNFPLRPA